MARLRWRVLLLVAVLAVGALYVFVDQRLLVRERETGTALLSPGESFNFSFDVFPIQSEVDYSFVVESGPEATVFINSTTAGGGLVESGTPLSGGYGMGEGTYRVTIYPGASAGVGSSSLVRYDVASSGYPVGSLGAVLYFLALPVLLLLAFVGIVGFLLTMEGLPARPPAYCSYCGRKSGEWRCPFCGLPRPYIWTRKW